MRLKLESRQKSFRAGEKRGKLRSERLFRTWLVRILINASRDILRKRKRSLPMDALPEPPDAFPDPALSEALGRLPEKLPLPSNYQQ